MLTAACSSHSDKPTASGCGYIYDVTLPNGQHHRLGGCNGGFNADAAPSITIARGAVLHARVVTSGGKPVVQLPTVKTPSVLTITGSTPTTLNLCATTTGHSTLIAHTDICSRPPIGSVPTCPVRYVVVH